MNILSIFVDTLCLLLIPAFLLILYARLVALAIYELKGGKYLSKDWKLNPDLIVSHCETESYIDIYHQQTLYAFYYTDGNFKWMESVRCPHLIQVGKNRVV